MLYALKILLRLQQLPLPRKQPQPRNLRPRRSPCLLKVYKTSIQLHTSFFKVIKNIHDLKYILAVCKNRLSKRKCNKVAKKKRCGIRFWSNRCVVTCGRCCGNIWGNGKCFKRRRSCNRRGRKGKKVRQNCRKQCRKCK